MPTKPPCKNASAGRWNPPATVRLPADDTLDGALDDTDTPRLKKRLVHSLCFLVPLMSLSMGHMIGLPLPPFLEGAGPGRWSTAFCSWR